MAYDFTSNWFDHAKDQWRLFLGNKRPKTILEIGSYEGASACYLIDGLGAHYPIHLSCLDTWEGGIDNAAAGHDMTAVEQRFLSNVEIACENAKHPVDLRVLKGRSDHILPRLLADGEAERFDLIYIDGSHQAPDVLFDAVVSLKLLKPGGTMIFDDYIWVDPHSEDRNILREPKVAIDAFVNIYAGQVAVMNRPVQQLFVRKLKGA